MSRFCKEKRSATHIAQDAKTLMCQNVTWRFVSIDTFLMLQPHVCISYLDIFRYNIFSWSHCSAQGHCKVFVMTRFQINQAHLQWCSFWRGSLHCTWERVHVDTWCEESVSQRVRAITELLSWCVGDLNSSDRYNLLNQRSWILFNALYFWPFGVTMHKLGGSWQQ